MFPVTERVQLHDTLVQLRVLAPRVAKKAKAGQFIIVRPFADSERIPLTIVSAEPEAGTVRIIFQTVGETTAELASIQAGESVADFAGPLGRPSELDGLREAVVVGGGVGSAIAFPVAKALHERGAKVHTILGFRTRELMILQEEFTAVSDTLTVVTDDGSFGRKALVTEPLRELLAAGTRADEVFAIGPLVMMKFVCRTTADFGVKTTVSMNPIMIDGSGMCGCCRLTVGGETKFACVDGPDFDGSLVDFDEAIRRGGVYKEQEAHARDACRLFQKEVR